VNIGLQTTRTEPGSEILSAVLIARGVALSVAGARRRLPRKGKPRGHLSYDPSVIQNPHSLPVVLPPNPLCHTRHGRLLSDTK
jgi:hypothetical protein